MTKKYAYLKYYPGEAFAYNKKNEIIGTVDPGGKFRSIGKRRIPPGEKRG